MATKKYSAETTAVFGVVFEIGFIVALPLVVLAYAGKWLDSNYGHKHFFLYLGIAVALLITALWFYSRFKQLVATLKKAAKLEHLDTNETENSNKR